MPVIDSQVECHEMNRMDGQKGCSECLQRHHPLPQERTKLSLIDFRLEYTRNKRYGYEKPNLFNISIAKDTIRISKVSAGHP